MHEPSTSQGHERSQPERGSARDRFTSYYCESFRVLWFTAVGIVGDRSLAEDVVQEAAIIGLEKFSQFQDGTSFSAWMGQIVRHVALNSMRKEHRRRTSPLDSDGEVQSPTGSPMNQPVASDPTADRMRLDSAQRGELAPDQRDFDDHVVHALGELTPAARACLLLRTVEQMEYREISGILGIPEGTAMSHVHRSRQLLRASLGKVGRSGTTAANPDGTSRATSEEA
jgi:RNA polymerase sigma-70 factor (ECF subfamily)